LKHWSWAKCN